MCQVCDAVNGTLVAGADHLEAIRANLRLTLDDDEKYEQIADAVAEVLNPVLKKEQEENRGNISLLVYLLTMSAACASVASAHHACNIHCDPELESRDDVQVKPNKPNLKSVH